MNRIKSRQPSRRQGQFLVLVRESDEGVRRPLVGLEQNPMGPDPAPGDPAGHTLAAGENPLRAGIGVLTQHQNRKPIRRGRTERRRIRRVILRRPENRRRPRPGRERLRKRIASPFNYRHRDSKHHPGDCRSTYHYRTPDGI